MFCSLETTDPLVYVLYVQFLLLPLGVTKSYTPDIYVRPVVRS